MNRTYQCSECGAQFRTRADAEAHLNTPCKARSDVLDIAIGIVLIVTLAIIAMICGAHRAITPRGE